MERRPEPPRHIPFLFAAVLLVLAAIAVWQRQALLPGKPAKPAPGIRTAKVRVTKLEQTIRLSGSTVAERAATLLAPRMPGSRHSGPSHFLLILRKLIAPGSMVKKGELVAEFDNMYMSLRMDDYRASTLMHESNLRRLRALLDVKRERYNQLIRSAKADMEKAALDLKKAPILSAINAEKFRLVHEEAIARYRQIQDEARYVDISEGAAIRRSELDLEQSRIELQRAERNLAKMTVHASIAGLVVMQTITRGSEVGEIKEGDQLYSGQPYMQIVDLHSMAIDANVNQADLERLRVGMRARVYFDAYPGMTLPAHIVSVGAYARSRGWRGDWVKQVPVRLRFDGTDPRLIPNLSASTELVLASSEDTLAIPREAVFTENAQPVAYVRDGEHWHKRHLELGLMSNIEAAVRSGIRVGEVVATEIPAEAAMP